MVSDSTNSRWTLAFFFWLFALFVIIDSKTFRFVITCRLFYDCYMLFKVDNITYNKLRTKNVAAQEPPIKLFMKSNKFIIYNLLINKCCYLMNFITFFSGILCTCKENTEIPRYDRSKSFQVYLKEYRLFERKKGDVQKLQLFHFWNLFILVAHIHVLRQQLIKCEERTVRYHSVSF